MDWCKATDLVLMQTDSSFCKSFKISMNITSVLCAFHENMSKHLPATVNLIHTNSSAPRTTPYVREVKRTEWKQWC